ncbi:MAG: hypothetical protein CL675_12955 [Bdellovibrionaceae bacterium]|nr:hypothetical protein [Pseudobdellovibrionaceae bacterium]
MFWLFFNSVFVLLAIFTVCFLLEQLFARRPRPQGRYQSWGVHAAMAAVNNLGLYFFLPVTAVAFSDLCMQKGWGALNQLQLADTWSVVVTVIVFDLALFIQHVATHRIPLLWRLHRVHHTDQHLDVSSGVRFHFVEIWLSMAYKFAVIFMLGAHPVGVFIFEIVLAGMTFFTHANLALPIGVDRWLRWLVVTPDMHRIHHSETESETNSNFGFNISLWDRLFRTYRDQSQRGQMGLVLGIKGFQDKTSTELVALWKQPFASSPESSGSSSSDPR